MTEIVKDWLWRQLWVNGAIEKFSHVCDGYKVDELDPEAIFNYQGKPAFYLYHFIVHMAIMQNALLWEPYRHHRQ